MANEKTAVRRANEWLKTLENDFSNYMVVENDDDGGIGSCGSVFKIYKRVETAGGIDTFDPDEDVKYCLKISPVGVDENDPRYKVALREFQIIDDIQGNRAQDVCIKYYHKDFYAAKDQDYAFIIMQYATNTLQRHLSERLLSKLDFSSREALQILKQICFALKKLQSWERYNRNNTNSEPLVLIHNDLRPVNILVDYKAGGIPKVRLTDFGVATYGNESADRIFDRTAQPNKANKALALGDYSIEFGSSPFYAPERGELATEEKIISTKTDIYSVGALAAWMLAKDPDAMLDALSRYRRGIVELSEIKGLIKDDVVKVINDFSLNKLEECLYPFAERNVSLDAIVEEIDFIMDHLDKETETESSINFEPEVKHYPQFDKKEKVSLIATIGWISIAIVNLRLCLLCYTVDFTLSPMVFLLIMVTPILVQYFLMISDQDIESGNYWKTSVMTIILWIMASFVFYFITMNNEVNLKPLAVISTVFLISQGFLTYNSDCSLLYVLFGGKPSKTILVTLGSIGIVLCSYLAFFAIRIISGGLF